MEHDSLISLLRRGGADLVLVLLQGCPHKDYFGEGQCPPDPHFPPVITNFNHTLFWGGGCQCAVAIL